MASNHNPLNSGKVIGRLARDIVVFNNKDGSKKLMFSVAVRDNFKSKNATGEMAYGVQYVPVETFLSKALVEKNLAKGNANDPQGLGVYAYIAKGDQVAVDYTCRSGSYESNGQTVYTLTLQVADISLLEPKATMEKRHKDTQAATAQGTAPAAAPAAAAGPADAIGEEAPFGEDA